MSRKSNGQFQQGVSGNPNGRPKTASVELRAQLQTHGPALVKKAVEMALAGDAVALRICLDRITPALKPTAETVALQLPADAGLAGAARAFVDAAAAGLLPPDIAAQMVGAVSKLAKVIEIDELERRISALEVRQ